MLNSLKPAEARESPPNHTYNNMTVLTFFYGFLDDFLQLYVFCFALYAVRSSSTQSVAVFEGCVGEGGRGVCVCKSYSMDSLLLSKTLAY